MLKKADMTINIIIVAIIALIVLVVLLAIFGGKMGIFVDSSGDVQDQVCEGGDSPGMIVASSQDCGEGYFVGYARYTDVSTGYKCCKPLRTTN